MTHRALAPTLALVVGGGLVLPACLGDDVPDQASAGGDTSTTAAALGTSTSGGPPLGTSGPTSEVEPGTSSTGQTSLASTGEATSTTGADASGSGTTGGSSSGSSGAQSETGIGEEGYGDCLNAPALEVCLAGETCIDDGAMPPSVAVCALQDCGSAGECPVPPPGGDASPACLDVTGDMVDECVLACGGGASCPTGMACFAEFVCVWGGGLGPGDFSCVDEDLGNAMGNAVATGTTVGQGNDFTPGCVMSNAPDVQFVWTALVGGTYTFDTVGSSFDTVLSVREDCMGPELACNDDTVMTKSQVSVDLAGGQSVMIVIDGWNNAAGNYVLNVG